MMTTSISTNEYVNVSGMSEIVIENKKGMKKIIPVRFGSYEEAVSWVRSRYKGYRITGAQKGLFR